MKKSYYRVWAVTRDGKGWLRDYALEADALARMASLKTNTDVRSTTMFTCYN